MWHKAFIGPLIGASILWGAPPPCAAQGDKTLARPAADKAPAGDKAPATGKVAADKAPATGKASADKVPSTDKPSADKTHAEVVAVVTQMQKIYDATQDLRAHFAQTQKGIMGQRQASGEVSLKKPGKMRWDYDKPEKKLFVADGTTLWVYEPEDEQAFKQPLLSSQLPAQVSFLFGKGKLLDDFDIARLPADKDKLGAPGDVLLKLVPRAATTQYRYIVFVVDPKSYLVKETVVYDQQGGSNHLVFSKIETNIKGGIDDGRFRFTPPAGTQVINTGR